MDTKPRRLYRREWKRNKPYLPKSTSLPLLRLTPSNRAVFFCEQCGFSNLLVPICLWCCWSSVEARRDFEANARKKLRRVGRSSPRLFGRPSLSLNTRQDFGFAGKQPPREGPRQGPGSTAPHGVDGYAVRAFTTVNGSSTRQGKRWPRSTSSSLVQESGEGDKAVQGQRQANSETKTESQIGDDPCGIGSGENNPEHLTITVELHPRPKAALITKDRTQEGRESRTNDPARDSALPSPTLRSPLGLQTCPQLGGRPTISTPGPSVSVHNEARPPSPAPNYIGTMELDASTPDTRPVTFTASNTGPTQLMWTTYTTTGVHYDQHPTTDCGGCIGPQETEAMDIDVATATQPDSISAMAHAETSCGESAQDSDVTAITNMTLTKTGRKRAPIPSILFDQRLYHTPSISDNPASHIPRTTEMTTDFSTTIPTQPATPPRTLRRQKKRLSNLGTLVTNSRINNLAPPEPPIPYTPPPALPQRSSPPQFTPPLPATVTPPQSPDQDAPRPVLSPAIVISAPTTTTPPTSAPSTPIASVSPNSLHSLPRIGTPKRPYYSTIRANMNGKSNSNLSQLSTPPASPSSPTSGRTFGSPGSSTHIRPITNVAQQKSASMMVVDSPPMSMVVEGVRTHRPASTPAVVTVPPLPPVVSMPTPISAPVPMHKRPSSPVRSVVSVFDPTSGEDDEKDDESSHTAYRQFGIGSTASRFGRMLRERRSGNNLKDKDKSRGERDKGGGGGYHFSLSFSRSLGRKRSGAYASFVRGSEERELDPPLPTMSMNRGYAGVGGFGSGRGCSMSGEMEMRMALAERNINTGGDAETGLGAAFRFQENQRPSCDSDGRITRGKGRKLIKMRSTLGLTTSPFTASPTSSPSKPRIGSKLKEMSYSFLGRFQGGDSNHS